MDNLALMRTMRRCLKICLLHRLQSQTAKRYSILRYLVTVVAVTAALLGVKLLIAWAAEIYLHPIPILGGWLKSLENRRAGQHCYLCFIGVWVRGGDPLPTGQNSDGIQGPWC